MKYIYTFLLYIVAVCSIKAQTIKLVDQGKPCSIRGLSVVNDNVAWLSGSKGHVALSNDGGITWAWQQVKGYEQSDFRDIEAFSDKEAIIMSSGTPALILKTTDGGASWHEAYRKDDKAYFLDAIAFSSPQHGYAMGDPIDGKFLLLETKDGGQTWTNFDIQPAAIPGEAAFAASGTCLNVSPVNGALILVTGGSVARKITIIDNKMHSRALPVAQGKPSKGIFSYALGMNREIFIGGDYEHNTRTDSVTCCLLVTTKRTNPHKIRQQPAGYQSCVVYLQDYVFVSTGTPGSNITTDGGLNWKPFDVNSFNVCQKAKNGKLVLMAGDKGKIGLLQL